jgi:hypothetical protein
VARRSDRVDCVRLHALVDQRALDRVCLALRGLHRGRGRSSLRMPVVFDLSGSTSEALLLDESPDSATPSRRKQHDE